MKTFESPSVANRGSLAATSVVLLAAVLTAACAGQSPQSSSPSVTAVTPTPSATVSGSVVGLSGWLYFYAYPDVYRLVPSGLELVVAGAPNANVSPDGAWIAYVDDSSLELVVIDRDGGQPRSVLSGVVGAGFEPAWSPDSRRLLVARIAGGEGQVSLGVVDVASGLFTALPQQIQGIHPLWSADGQRLVYATGTCQIMVADVDGGNARMVPVFGDLDASVNPQRRRSCDPYSVSPDGSLVAVNQRTGDEPDGDIGRDVWANAVVDTRTGADVALPVSGQINAILFQPDGKILVRSTDADITTLTLLNPDRTVKTQVTEPANLTCGQYLCRLLAHTPN
jgi:TolB protein